MELTELKPRPEIQENAKLYTKYTQFIALIDELRQKELTPEVVDTINEDIRTINQCNGTDKELLKLLRKKQSCILNELAKKLKIVTKGYYRNMWMVLGMSIFGIPFGLMFSMALNNFAFIGIGLPMGMPIGMAVGASMDKKAAEEGRQLQVTLNAR